MKVSVHDAVRQIEARALLTRLPADHSDRIIDHAQRLLGRELPADLADFYREGVHKIGFYKTATPIWDERRGWRTPDDYITALLHVDAVPVAFDIFGNSYGLDLTADVETPAVYLFDHEREHMLESAAGSSLGAFLLLFADHDRAMEENWPLHWELKIDPDIDHCPRARAEWVTG